MGGVQRLFEQRRQQVASTRRDAASLAGVAVGARVRSHYYAGTKPDRKKSEQAEEAIVIGVHFKGEEDIAAPSQLEVQLEFLRQDERCLRGGRKTCVPAHWIVSTEEDAEVAAALREVGIHEEDQPFWDSIFPASEMREVCRLTSCQRRALAQIRAHAAASHEEAEPRVLERFQKMGFSDKELQAVLSWIQDLAPVIIHVNIDTVGRFLESDEYYRSQFETKTSYGAIDEGNQTRVTWERDLFGDAYDDAKPFERCKYGALNATWSDGRAGILNTSALAEPVGPVTNDFEGCKPALQYGDSYLVLKDVRLRCTFAPEDSGGISGSRLAVLDKYAHVLEEYEDEEIRKLVDVATAPPARPSSEAPRLLRGSTEDPTQQWVSFGFPQLKRKAGCFFFEVELIEECSLPQVGLASDLFQCLPGVQSTSGIGDDEYSCGVDGMHGSPLRWPKQEAYRRIRRNRRNRVQLTHVTLRCLLEGWASLCLGCQLEEERLRCLLRGRTSVCSGRKSRGGSRGGLRFPCNLLCIQRGLERAVEATSLGRGHANLQRGPLSRHLPQGPRVLPVWARLQASSPATGTDL
ncbi:Caskin1 [Symbiodinium natans]|uniref:Caskin1 protein n=1 Tax=Symbiodinium natans TaxID=878477 RepID=A0A812V809_9DINO|nr:Caskin1 [Symbiodinium natans]